jgi:hypothetical protein
LIGNATATNATVTKGVNTVAGQITYGPATPEDVIFGEIFLGKYLSGERINITARFHKGSLPGNPALSAALDGLNITLPVPSIHLKDPASTKKPPPSPFLRSATVHLLSRTAQFELYNPLVNAGITIVSLMANATYDNETIGTITEPEFDFAVLPGRDGFTETGKIPVEVGTVGYDVIKRALGGELVVDAVADVVAKIGKWVGNIQYHGQGLGASVRL